MYVLCVGGKLSVLVTMVQLKKTTRNHHFARDFAIFNGEKLVLLKGEEVENGHGEIDEREKREVY